MSTTSDILRGVTYFADVPEDVLARVSDASEELEFPDGTRIID